MSRLEKEGLLDNTVVFFMTDHGISHARGKQFLYDEGIHVPLVAAGPGIPKGEVRSDLVEHIDLAATSLSIAGVRPPAWMQGRDLLSKDYRKRDAVFAARDRCDETMEHIRAVRTDRYKYIRNYLPNRPHLQPCRYKDEKAIVKRLRELHAAGTLDSLAEKLLFAPRRPAEELYDLGGDPHETNNLAADPAHQETLKAMRSRLAEWERRTADKGRQPEPVEMYDSDMKEYLSGGGKTALEDLRGNIDLNKRWAAEEAKSAGR
jgi:arylsulfatase A-like enzyme